MLALLGTAAALAQGLPEGLELAVLAEFPPIATPALRLAPEDRGEPQLQVGGLVRAGWSPAPGWSLSAGVGLRSAQLSWPPPAVGADRVFAQHRVLRLQLGAWRALGEGPLTPTLGLEAGLASAAWSLDLGEAVSSRSSRGAALGAVAGLRWEVAPPVALAAELRGFAEGYGAREVEVGEARYEAPPGRVGLALSLGVRLGGAGP